MTLLTLLVLAGLAVVLAFLLRRRGREARFATVAPAGAIVRTGSPVIAGVRHTPLVFS